MVITPLDLWNWTVNEILTSCIFLEGKPVPDHATFARFRSIHFAPCAKRILAEMSNLLYELGEISGETIFIDGTKIEACANKYTFIRYKNYRGGFKYANNNRS